MSAEEGGRNQQKKGCPTINDTCPQDQGLCQLPNGFPNPFQEDLINDYEESQRYVKPTRSAAKPAPKPSSAFEVRVGS